jgi:hypothetical protein
MILSAIVNPHERGNLKFTPTLTIGNVIPAQAGTSVGLTCSKKTLLNELHGKRYEVPACAGMTLPMVKVGVNLRFPLW